MKTILVTGMQFKQGFYIQALDLTEEQKRKYVGNLETAVYRSGWELKFFKFAMSTPAITGINSEDVIIPYQAMDGSKHRYFVDFWIRFRTKSGVEKTALIEIKPHSQIFPPVLEKTKTGRVTEKRRRYFENAKLTYEKNKMKWLHAKEFCSYNNCEFFIVTEDPKVDTRFNDIRFKLWSLDEIGL